MLFFYVTNAKNCRKRDKDFIILERFSLYSEQVVKSSKSCVTIPSFRNFIAMKDTVPGLLLIIRCGKIVTKFQNKTPFL